MKVSHNIPEGIPYSRLKLGKTYLLMQIRAFDINEEIKEYVMISAEVVKLVHSSHYMMGFLVEKYNETRHYHAGEYNRIHGFYYWTLRYVA